MMRYSLEAILVVLLLLWLLGAFVYPVGGSLIHILLVVVVAVFVLRLLQGRRLLD
jgi:K+-transporting ATPase A subunit